MQSTDEKKLALWDDVKDKLKSIPRYRMFDNGDFDIFQTGGWVDYGDVARILSDIKRIEEIK